VNQAAINVDALARMLIPVPPLAEQERIVRLLDEADALRKLRTQADRRTADLIPALFHEMFGGDDTSNNRQLGEVCIKITDGVHLTPTYVDDGVPFLRVTDIHKPEIDWTSVKRIPQHEYEQMTRRVKPEMGDILYSKNGTIGIAKEISWNRPFAHFVSLALLKLQRDIINPTFLATYLNTPDALRQAIGHSKAGTVTNLHLNEIRKIRIPCPSSKEQDDFVARMTEIRALEAEQSKSRSRLDDLFQSMLHRAFSGEL
jgi:type I restriction enzyme S subunit